ncbi:transporter substrate-binding domain-containing protein [Rheinheimera riviphila]|uniref:Transporter substrate-binding domain-containing protein n=1 Tax=Rheinheimera riviphila TaxID=1834037 RepID=A0A437QC55_9GAMM|nr:transporter substrate-binding domain-containing protein [Rheinheimera riviphila]
MPRLAFTLFCSLLLFGSAHATADDRLTFYTEHFPPYNFEQNGAIRGINADILTQACVIANIKCDMQLYPWLRAMELAQKNPASGIFTISRTKSRVPLFQWVGPIASSTAYLYRLATRPEVAAKTLEQAKQFSIAVAHGDVYEEFLLSQGFEYGKNLIEFRSKSEPIPLFIQGKVDLVIGSDIVIPSWLASHQLPAETAVPVIELNTTGNNFLALNHAVPIELANRLQQAIDQLKQNGKYQQIVESYQGKNQ